MTATPDEATVARWDEARALAERGDLKAAEQRFAEVVEIADDELRARAALGLAAVRDELGDAAGAAAADKIAIATKHPDHAPRAAYHLALCSERAGHKQAARGAWQQVVAFGNADYLPNAYLALGYLADEAGDPESARDHWQRAAASDDRSCAAAAAQELADRLVADGAVDEAAQVLTTALNGPAAGTAGLWAALSITCLEQAMGALGAAIELDDPNVTPLAVELLARVLPLRGRDDDAAGVWQQGIDHPDPQVAADIGDRLRRGFGAAEGDAPRPWWEDLVAAATRDGTLPQLTVELFAAIDQAHATAAAGYLADLKDTTHDQAGAALRRAIGVPGEYEWGTDLYADFTDRMRAEADSELPADDWPPRP